jgi:hypothetical protein
MFNLLTMLILILSGRMSAGNDNTIGFMLLGTLELIMEGVLLSSLIVM